MVGDRVFGTADFVGQPTAGAGDQAILNHWALVPDGLDLIHAAALPMAVTTAYGTLEIFGVTAGKTVLIHGAGSTIGYATAGNSRAAELAALGATVTSYGEGMAERVRELAGGDPRRVMTISDFTAAAELGVRRNIDEGTVPPYEALGEFAQYAANGKFSIPIAKTFPLTDWRTALEISENGHARGKLVLLP